MTKRAWLGIAAALIAGGYATFQHYKLYLPGLIAQLREQRLAVQPGIQLAQLPAGPVVRMDPIPDGSTPEGAARLAEERGFGAQPMPAPVRLASAGPFSGAVVGM
jgi:hypothetical protein